MKKLTSFLVAIIVLSVLTACAEDVELELFSETYKPTDISSITDVCLYGSELFVSDETKVLVCDIISGEESTFCTGEVGIDIICVDSERVYTYSHDAAVLKIWDKAEKKTIGEVDLSETVLGNDVKGIAVTENYIAVLGFHDVLKIDKTTYASDSINIDEQAFPNAITSCADDVIGLAYEADSSSENYIQRYDLKAEKEINRVYPKVYSLDVAYDGKDGGFYITEHGSPLDISYVKKIEETNSGVNCAKIAQTVLN